MKKSCGQKGFTLIELLVAITIIGILAAIIYANFGDARNNARNRDMQVELKKFQLAMESYRAEHNRYPEATVVAGRAWCGTPFDTRMPVSEFDINPIFLSTAGTFSDPPYTFGCGDNVPIIAGLYPEYIDEPLIINHKKKSGNPDCGLAYWVDGTGSQYKLYAFHCVAGAESQALGVQEKDEFAVCPQSCGPGNCGGPWKQILLDEGQSLGSAFNPTTERFYQSYAVYSNGAECF